MAVFLAQGNPQQQRKKKQRMVPVDAITADSGFKAKTAAIASRAATEHLSSMNTANPNKNTTAAASVNSCSKQDLTVHNIFWSRCVVVRPSGV
jgi:hypothetical protein